MSSSEYSASDLNLLVTLFNQGHYNATEVLARDLTSRFPDNGFGWKVLGVVLRQQGKLTAAVQPMQKAAQLLPDDAEAHSNLGVALMNQGQLDDAVLSYQHALTLNPNNADVHHHLGLTLMTLGQLSKAAECYHRVLALNPDYSDAYFNLGRVYQEQGQLSEAEQCYRQVLLAHPDTAEAHNNLAFVLYWQHRLADAEDHYQRALALNPQDITAYSRLGMLLQTQGRLSEARDCYECALEINPEFAEIHNNLGIVLHELGLTYQAEASYQHALAINPQCAEVYNNLGLTLQSQGRLAKAEEAYRNALASNPHYSEAHNNLGMVFQQRGELLAALASYQRALTLKSDDAQVHNNLGTIYKDLGRLNCAEASFRRALVRKPDYIAARSNLLFVMNYNPAHTPEDCLAEAQQYGDIVSSNVDVPFTTWLCEERLERLRVGIVSGDLLSHDIGVLLNSLLPELDSSCLELIAYPTHNHSDAITTQLQDYFSAWKPLVGLSDAAAARLIYSDAVHILLDLSGHNNYNRLPVFAYKPAPIQVSWLGSLTPSGVTAIDYMLGDPYTTPVDIVSETVWQLPEVYRCFSVPTLPLEVNALPALTTGMITFGSFNALGNMNEAVIALWAQILHAVPQSQLLLTAQQLNDETLYVAIRQSFAEHGVLPERLVLESNADLSVYHRIDIALDTFPHNGTTTSAHALWMGVPVLTLLGDRFIARCGASILSNAELANWIAVNDADVLAKAVQFAGNLPYLADLRSQLREQVLASPVFDMSGFARQFEAALWSM